MSCIFRFSNIGLDGMLGEEFHGDYSVKQFMIYITTRQAHFNLRRNFFLRSKEIN